MIKGHAIKNYFADEIKRELNNEPVELTLARRMKDNDFSEADVVEVLEDKKLRTIPEPLKLNIRNYYRDLERGIRK